MKAYQQLFNQKDKELLARLLTLAEEVKKALSTTSQASVTINTFAFDLK